MSTYTTKMNSVASKTIVPVTCSESQISTGQTIYQSNLYYTFPGDKNVKRQEKEVTPWTITNILR